MIRLYDNNLPYDWFLLLHIKGDKACIHTDLFIVQLFVFVTTLFINTSK